MLHSFQMVEKRYTVQIWVNDPEAVVQSCSIKKAFLKIPQNSRENACVRVFLNKIAGLKPVTLLKKDFDTGVFL